ncbi:MAG: hypothetical protein CM1200mP32_03460 [Methanobacteriota archaeon]|nr:MAG: hypothetical protein CM1200mP32_03460 [Euryarchaeota archaeon]
MNAGIGEGKTREDHKSVSDQLMPPMQGGGNSEDWWQTSERTRSTSEIYSC